MAYVQIKEPVTAQVVLAFVSQGLKETVVKVDIIVMLDFMKDFGDFFNILTKYQVFLNLPINHFRQVMPWCSRAMAQGSNCMLWTWQV
jgi:hypothetical protein